MASTALIVGLTLCLQVPPPTSAEAAAGELERAARAISTREADALRALAAKLETKGENKAAERVRGLLPKPTRGTATRFAPLLDVVEPRSGLASPSVEAGWEAELHAIRSAAGEDLFELAKKAAEAVPPQMARADRLLRETLARLPDHAETRRLLGYVRHEGGWARPFAVRQLNDGYVSHPTYGWVPVDWITHLELGELPAPAVRGRSTTWLPAAEADRLRSDWSNPWRISTEHFQIQSDAPLAEAIQFGRRLEDFYGLFFSQCADLIGENLPLARRFRNTSLTGDGAYRPHQVLYFADNADYVHRIRIDTGADLSGTLGYYDPPKPGKGGRSTAYFFRDADGRLPVEATLYHEVSHQLLFESAGPNAFTKNVGAYWVFEGLGTYFETVVRESDDSLEVGGLVGPRLEAAIGALRAGQMTPLGEFLQLDQSGFNRPDRIHVHYQQAMALALFLMQADEGAYREPFLDYARDAYRGRIKRSSGRSLEDRLGVPVGEIERRFKAFYTRRTAG